IMNQEQQEQALAKLRELIEGVIERKMKTPKDFEFLSECIFEKYHEKISPTTLKRLWGYLSESTTPRKSTLDILSMFVGYDNWKDFCKKNPIEEEKRKEERGENRDEKTQKKRLSPAILYTIIALLLIGAISGVAYHIVSKSPDKSSTYTLKIGDSFSSPHEYLKLFGIHAKEKLWGQILPHHPNISVWGPDYHNKEWHNEGDKSKMMPTITEYWKPEGADSARIVERNIDQFNHCSRLNEIRITFMKNLIDTNYVFLGVYRLSFDLSDSTKVIWERVANECDLNNLDYLEELRN
ncbi:MAG: hypothetical protein K6C10_10530, partial [Prevotella sp.]|nr:hypothetical protein [Prevotella sp.]